MTKGLLHLINSTHPALPLEMGPQIWTADKSCLVCSSGGMLREVHACSLDLLLSDWKRREARAFIQAFSYKPVKPKVWLPCTAAAAGLESNMSHQANPEVWRHFVVLGFFLAALSVSVSPDEACFLFALQSCVFGCEGNVADVRKTV